MRHQKLTSAVIRTAEFTEELEIKEQIIGFLVSEERTRISLALYTAKKKIDKLNVPFDDDRSQVYANRSNEKKTQACKEHSFRCRSLGHISVSLYLKSK